MQRRQLLRTVAAGATVGIAGCTEGGTDSGGGPTVSPTPTSTPSGGGASGATTEPTAEPTTDPPAEPSGTDTPASVGGPALGELGVQFENDYRFSVDVPTVEGTVQGAWSGGNYVSRVDVGGDTVESYFVDGDTYVVAAGSCSAVPNSGGATGVDTGELAGTDGAERNVEQYGSITANGTTTIDGESVYVFELGGEASATYYVSAATNRLRRVVAEGVTIDYYDWGQVGSITVPC